MLQACRKGDRAAADRLVEAAYHHLRALAASYMRHERQNQRSSQRRWCMNYMAASSPGVPSNGRTALTSSLLRRGSCGAFW